jgi:NitT/TauT family transport system ATP-binding protein
MEMEDNLQHEECIIDEIPDRNVKRMEKLLQVCNVHKSYKQNDGTQLKVLEDFSMDVTDILHKPQIVGLLGPSGCGKTTALRLIAGLEKPDSGQVLLSNGGKGNHHVLCPVQQGQVGVVFQKYPLFENLTLFENLVVPAVKTGSNREEAEIRASTYLEAFKLGKSAHSYPVQASGGMRQRVAILQQLMIENRHFITLDEPFSGLDTENIHAVMQLISTIANMHTLNTFVIITHDVTSALTITDHIYLIGREYDKGIPVTGGKVIREYDLIEEGMAYRPNVEDLPRFAEIRKEIKEMMRKL